MIGTVLLVRYPRHGAASVDRWKCEASEQSQCSVNVLVAFGRIVLAVENVVDGYPVVVECGGRVDVRIGGAETELVSQGSGAEGQAVEMLAVNGQFLLHIGFAAVEKLCGSNNIFNNKKTNITKC